MEIVSGGQVIPAEVPNIWHFFQEYQSLLDLDFLQRSVSSCIIERAMLDYECVVQYPPSMIATAAITITGAMVGDLDSRNYTARNVPLEFVDILRSRRQLRAFEGVNPLLGLYSKYTSAYLVDCMNRIMSLFCEDSCFSSMVFAKALVNKKRQQLLPENAAPAPFSYTEFLQYLQEDVLKVSISHTISYDKEHLRFFTAIPSVLEDAYLKGRNAEVFSADMWEDFVERINRQINGISNSPRVYSKNGAMNRYPLIYSFLSNHLVFTEHITDLVNAYSSVIDVSHQ